MATSLDVSSTNCTASSTNPTDFNPSLNASAIALLEFIASLPPLKITAFPDLKQSPAASLVTFGLASYIIPITPIGTLFLPICNPLGLVHIPKTSPTGSSSAATCLRQLAIPSILASFKANLSSILSLVPFILDVSRSFLLASIITLEFSIRKSAIAYNASFLSLEERLPKI